MTALISQALRELVPAPDAPASAYPRAFRAIAELVLNQTTLRVADVAHRVAEVEFYFDGRAHRDPFVHGDAGQRQFARWYFHRVGRSYRGGSFKGLDLALGADDLCAGMLLRAIARITPPEGVVRGPCRTVDRILSLAQRDTVAALAESFDLSADAPSAGTSPLCLTVDARSRAQTVYAGPRVGLTLKRGVTAERVAMLSAPYRFLTDPPRGHKGLVAL